MDPNYPEYFKIATWVLDWSLRLLGTVAIPGGVYIGRRLARMGKRLDNLEHCVDTLENRVCALPSSENISQKIHRVELEISVLGGKIDAMGGLMERLDRVVYRQEDHLLNGGRN